MPGPVSDAYDPEWGTAANAETLRQALLFTRYQVSMFLNDAPPVYALELLEPGAYPDVIEAALTERFWRLIRFALERAAESL